ncbi:MAG: hypothetical protein ABSD63_09975 [Candidatus Korobacteraceae bacterium]|jgi:hypothetical protein
MEMEDQPKGRTSDLKALAEAEFGKGTFSNAEKLLLEKVPVGEWAICGPNSTDRDKANDPQDADNWGPKRQIRAELVGWLCMDEHARKRVHWRGIQVYGADVTGPLDLPFVNIPFQLALRHCRLKAAINLRSAEVSQLDLQGSLVYGITADGLIVKNSVFLGAGFTAIGEVRLPRAQIGGDLSCEDGTFTNPSKKDFSRSGIALNADGIDVKGYVFLRKSTTKGAVRLLGAQIGANLECDGGAFTNPPQKDLPRSGTALDAERSNVKGMVFLRDGFTADGVVNLDAAQIGRGFSCANANFQRATLQLRDASAASLIDSGLNDTSSVADGGPTIWPQPSKLPLDGFVYRHIYSEGRINVTKRLYWLGLQPTTPFRQQPYLQLAKILRESGDLDGAKQVLEKMEALRRSHDGPGWMARLWSWILRRSIGYGYHPGRAIWLIILLSVVGWIVYGTSYHAGRMAPTDKDAYNEFRDPKTTGQVPPHYPNFSAPIYSLENSLPLVKLGQGDKWQPDPGRKGPLPTFILWFLRVQIMLGWLLATLFVAGVSGIVRKE